MITHNRVEKAAQQYWEASRAWHGRPLEGTLITNTGSLINELRMLCVDANWRIASYSGRILEDVIEDRMTTNDCPAEVVALNIHQKFKTCRNYMLQSFNNDLTINQGSNIA